MFFEDLAKLPRVIEKAVHICAAEESVVVTTLRVRAPVSFAYVSVQFARCRYFQSFGSAAAGGCDIQSIHTRIVDSPSFENRPLGHTTLVMN